MMVPVDFAARPLLTVVTATFNLLKNGRAEAFRRCVESVHHQTCVDVIEHLVIDGASEDGTRELIAEYEAKGWLHCRSEKDAGIYDAMNKGIAAAKGKYIAFLNSDDYWHDAHGIERSLAVLESAEADFSYAPETLIYENGMRVTSDPQIGAAFSGMPFCHQTMLTRTDAIRRLGGFRSAQYRCAADYDLILRLLVHGAKAVYVPLNFTTFCLGGFSTQDEVWIKEVPMAQHAVLGQFFDAETVDEIAGGMFSDAAFRTLGGLLHPTVYAELQRATEPEKRLPRTLQFSKRFSTNLMDRQVSGLFGLRFWRTRQVSEHPFSLRLSVFGCPLCVTQYTPERTVCRLFGWLPLWSVTRRHFNSSVLCIWGVPIAARRWRRHR